MLHPASIEKIQIYIGIPFDAIRFFEGPSIVNRNYEILVQYEVYTGAITNVGELLSIWIYMD